MRYRGLDSNGDYVFGTGQKVFLTKAQSVAQALKTTLLFFKGEWWENTNDGTPMFQSILGQAGGQKTAVDRILQERILGVEGVTGISNMSTSLTNRQYSFSVVVSTQYGKVVVSNSSNSIPDSSAFTILSGTYLGDGDGNILSDGGTTLFTT